MDSFLVFIIGLATLCIVLGFVALLTQKVYIDKETKQPTDINIPLVGRMKTNYPALIFVVAGVLLVYLAMGKLPLPLETWTIEGQLMSSEENVNWQEGTIYLHPFGTPPDITRGGKFTIKCELEKGKKIHEVIQYIDYSHYSKGSVKIYPKKEYDLYLIDREKSKIKDITETSIEYKPVSLIKLKGD
jgi:hypothetical protein